MSEHENGWFGFNYNLTNYASVYYIYYTLSSVYISITIAWNETKLSWNMLSMHWISFNIILVHLIVHFSDAISQIKNSRIVMIICNGTKYFCNV